MNNTDQQKLGKGLGEMHIESNNLIHKVLVINRWLYRNHKSIKGWKKLG